MKKWMVVLGLCILHAALMSCAGTQQNGDFMELKDLLSQQAVVEFDTSKSEVNVFDVFYFGDRDTFFTSVDYTVFAVGNKITLRQKGLTEIIEVSLEPHKGAVKVALMEMSQAGQYLPPMEKLAIVRSSPDALSLFKDNFIDEIFLRANRVAERLKKGEYTDPMLIGIIIDQMRIRAAK